MASTLRRALSLLRIPGNELAYGLRAALRWQRGAPPLPDEDKAGLFAHLDPEDAARAAADAQALHDRYDLRALRAASTALVYAENLALLRLLERLAGDVELPAEELLAVDVGCGDFRYATALQRWLAHHGAPRRVGLRGIERDAYGIYRDGRSRADHGRAHAALAGDGVRFEVGDGCRLPPGCADVVTMFYPFLLPYPLLCWGAPLHHYRPRRLLAAAVAALRPGGLLLVANQTRREAERLRFLLRAAPLQLLRCSNLGDPWLPYAAATAGRTGTLWRRR